MLQIKSARWNFKTYKVLGHDTRTLGDQSLEISPVIAVDSMAELQGFVELQVMMQLRLGLATRDAAETVRVVNVKAMGLFSVKISGASG
eukprot:Skav219870  [mRNA]  locus=scaffold777:100207:101409:+ [translate_table: standard]